MDTTDLIDYLRGKPAARLFGARLSGHDLCVSVISVSELYSGLRPLEQTDAAALLAGLRWIPVSGDVAVLAGEMRRQPSRQGITLALADMLIAATADRLRGSSRYVQSQTFSHAGDLVL